MDSLLNEMKGAATKVSDKAGAATNNALDGLTSSTGEAFGSPHLGMGSSPQAPLSPVDAPAKQLDFGYGTGKLGTPASPATPGLPVPESTKGNTPAPAPGTPTTPPLYKVVPEDDADVDYDGFIRDTLLWVNKVRSGVYLVGGLVLILLTHRLLHSRISIVTAVCWELLAVGALNFLRAFAAPKLQDRCTWHDSAWTAGFVNRVSSATFGTAALVDKHLSGKEPARMLPIVLALWGISLAGRIAGFTGLAALLWVVAFTAPKAYTLQKPKIDGVVTKVVDQVKARFLALDPKARAALIVVPILVAGYALSPLDLCIALFALSLYGRSLLAPAQVQKLNSVVGGPINTVSKVSDTVSALVVGAANKYELTPTPLKRKVA